MFQVSSENRMLISFISHICIKIFKSKIKKKGNTFLKINLFIYIYFWLRWVFIAVCGLSLVVASGAALHCGARASHCGGFSRCRARAPGAWASVVVACRLSSCGTQAQLFRGMLDLPGPGIEPVPSALSGGLPTTVPPGKSLKYFFNFKICREERVDKVNPIVTLCVRHILDPAIPRMNKLIIKEKTIQLMNKKHRQIFMIHGEKTQSESMLEGMIYSAQNVQGRINKESQSSKEIYETHVKCTTVPCDQR